MRNLYSSVCLRVCRTLFGLTLLNTWKVSTVFACIDYDDLTAWNPCSAEWLSDTARRSDCSAHYRLQ